MHILRKILCWLVFGILILVIGMFVSRYIKSETAYFQEQSHIESFISKKPPESAEYKNVLVDQVWVKVPHRSYNIYPYSDRRGKRKEMIEGPVYARSISFRYTLEELIGIEDWRPSATIVVGLRYGIELDISHIFDNKDRRWKISPVPKWGLNRYEENKIRGAIYYRPIDHSVISPKGYLLNYHCHNDENTKIITTCTGSFEIAPNLNVDYIISAKSFEHWFEIHNSIIDKIKPMLTNTY